MACGKTVQDLEFSKLFTRCSWDAWLCLVHSSSSYKPLDAESSQKGRRGEKTQASESHKNCSFPLIQKAIYGDSSILLHDSPIRYFRHSSDRSVSLSEAEIGGTALVLHGFAPSSTSSSKLNEVLMPNPFDRPRAMLMVEVTGAEESQLIADSDRTPSRMFRGSRLKVIKGWTFSCKVQVEDGR
ncbi:hypothetical protein ACS0TY_027061 [Phlomoides rotata]